MFRHPYSVIEPVVIGLFLLMAFDAARRGGRRELLVIVSAALYGLLLEEGDMLIFQSYHYSPDFILTIDRVPLVIGLAWAVIIITCLRLTDAFGIPARWAPFADALWAIILDLSFDAIAIRLGLWSWKIGLDDGFFGVPAGNFYAWLMVAFSFSFSTRWVRQRGGQPLWQILVPLVAYVGLLLGMLPFIFLKLVFFDVPGGGYPIFWAALTVCAAVTVLALAQRRFRPLHSYDPLAAGARFSFHAFFLAALVAESMFLETPALAVVAFGMLGLEIFLALVAGSFSLGSLRLPRRAWLRVE